MCRAPFVMPKAETAFSRNAEIYDTTIGWRFVNPLMKKQYGVDSMPETGENVAEQFQRQPRRPGRLRRAQPGKGRRRAGERPAGQGDRRRDDPAAQRRPDRGRQGRASARRHDGRDARPSCRTPFKKEGGTVTAGNASGVNDGAAALIVASEAAVKKYGLTPIARVLGGAAAGVAPRIMGFGPAPATQQAVRAARHEGFRLRRDRAQRSLRHPGHRRAARSRHRRRRRACEPEWRRDRARPSARHVGRAHRRHGCAGAQGARARKLALATMCIGVGQGISIAIERV